MSNDWNLQCEPPDPNWKLTPAQEAAWYKLQMAVNGTWEKQKKNDVPTTTCEEGKFRPEQSYG